ncbi:sodium- and chloride-dependent glycine transporter 1-like [Amphibalanus amphitrite]|uniref:sodium- and chloride-dependent glycine transporter 1-like n=1 Tax=Amphibalanus amphitrite TaxID=1232801 RepID=UPI001C907E64|nr:sodium- and chloride-dependent glycine transporter 1-like [Amphibalanus amphitrite]
MDYFVTIPESRSTKETEASTTDGTEQVTLPEVPAVNTKKPATLTPSLLLLAETRKRKINTEFGTIVVDSEGIEVLSNDSKDSRTVRKTRFRDPAARKFECPQCDLVPQEAAQRPGGSRMILFNPARTVSRLLESMTERKVREDRGVWGSDGELLAVGCSALVSVVTLLYMPHLSLQHSGGAFLLMYAACLVLFGAPMLLLEAALGQFCGHGLARLMPEMAPVLKGFSYAMLVSLIVIAITYMPVVSSAALYSVEATRSPAAWSTCSNSYNGPLCYTHRLDQSCQSQGAALFVGRRCLTLREVCEPTDERVARWNLSSACVPQSNRSFTFNHTRLHQLRTVAGVEFFDRVPYAVIPGLRRAQGAVAISLLVCWMLAALVSQAGAAGVRYTLPFVIGAPLLVVTALTISLLSSQRAARAALSLLAIDPVSLADSRDWLNAAKYTLCTQSTGLGVNSFIYSRNMLTHNCKRSAVTLIAVKFAVSVMCVVCYALMAGTHAVEVGEEARELTAAYGDHHALVRLTSTLGMLPDSENWSVLMLLAIVLAGLGFVQIVLLTIEASLRELNLVRGLSTRAVVLLLCAVFFVVDAVSTVQASYFTFLSVYQHVSVYISIALTTALLVAVNSTLSVERLLDDLRDAMNVSMRWSFNYWGISWCIVCPVLLVVLFFGTVVEEAMLPGRPLRGEVTGWTFSVSGLLAAGPVGLLLGYVLIECRRTERFDSELDVCAPTRHWRPGLLDECVVRQQPSQEVIDKSSQALMTSKSSLMTYVYSPVIGWSTEDLASKGGGSRGRSPAAEP